MSECQAVGGMRIDKGSRSRRTQGKPAPSATLSATNTTWPDLVSNLGRGGGKPATNGLSYGTACLQMLMQTKRVISEADKYLSRCQLFVIQILYSIRTA
jgi:PIN domain nuclease of toxin-antitoxin system